MNATQSTHASPADGGTDPQGAACCVRRSLLRTVSARFGVTPPDVASAAEAEQDLEVLLRWYEAAAVALSIEQLRNAV